MEARARNIIDNVRPDSGASDIEFRNNIFLDYIYLFSCILMGQTSQVHVMYKRLLKLFAVCNCVNEFSELLNVFFRWRVFE